MRKRTNQKTLLCSIVLLLVTVVGCFGIVAYSTYITQTMNTFTVGYNTITIDEHFEPPEELLPGISIPKEVAIKNTGPTPCYVRVMTKYTNSHMEGLSTLDFNTEDWEQIGDYYYYKEALAPGEKAEYLFTEITISDDVEQSDLEAFDVLVYAESRHVKAGQTYKSAWGL